MDIIPLTISFRGDIAYIYVWFSKEWQALYVGQTNNINVTLGRALNHIGNQGTLRNRFEETIGIKLEKANDFILLSFPLPDEKKYVSNESCYREAIEYMVQKNLIFAKNKLNSSYKIISNVRSNDLVGAKSLEIIAEKITTKFINIYKDI
ncbi:MAG: hypothetical protein ACOCRO_11250 [Halanaerobiales bacterium]